ncbi:hypothetical protein FEM48_Zijuj04G0154600 [Ziziphus jujuba var. spinosa]|uniref:EGF-like domain-containing protein n=1 Tax=Ziziphus jujuba var. spinosa TaxID=714518 RepID=A0A978VKN5_ZIZJJ|nr:hypothetical protein FEM48_Zijuj04G0154600 [Ziziphus jujuba var. spinosa]
MSKPIILNLVSMILLFTVNTLVLQPRAAVSDSPKPNCKTSCGKVSIPYPFGMGNSSCYFDEWYQIDCLNLSGNYTPFLRLTNVEVLEISISEGTVTVENPITFSSCDDKVYREAANLTGSSFVYSQKRNRFTAVSCNKLAYMNSAGDQSSSYSRNSASQTNVILAACMSICDKNTTDGSCNGMNCCQTTIPSNLMVFSTDLNPDTYNRHERCRYAFLVDQKWFELRSKSYLDIPSKMDSVPVVLEWNLLYNNLGVQVFGKFPDQMDKPKRFNSTSYCQRDNTTTSIFNYTRIQCYCDRGFEGNPYLLHGCQDINECENPPDDCKDHTCVNTHGGYTCQKKERIDPTTQRMLQVELEGIQMLAKTVTTSSSVPQNYEEVECLRTHVTEPWDVVSLSTGPAFDTDCSFIILDNFGLNYVIHEMDDRGRRPEIRIKDGEGLANNYYAPKLLAMDQINNIDHDIGSTHCQARLSNSLRKCEQSRSLLGLDRPIVTSTNGSK